MLDFNCGFSNCSKFSLVQLLSPCRRGDPGNCFSFVSQVLLAVFLLLT